MNIPVLRAALCVGQHFLTDPVAKERAATIDAGEPIHFESVPDNPYDAHAVAVICSNLNVRIGWVQAMFSPLVQALIEDGDIRLVGEVVGKGKNGNFSYNAYVETQD